MPGRQGRHRADRFFADAVRAINVAGIKPVIDRTFSFEDTQAAYHFLESGSHFGKVAIDLDPQKRFVCVMISPSPSNYFVTARNAVA
ncbi:zinc-binding dehydrogenase [Paraburkholderia sediminicola]|uniref:zinc-binding dehydrogenase n=1 Tax=Paraburkholderia sediminicola TaxID=458836 RepID=UPI0038B955BA